MVGLAASPAASSEMNQSMTVQVQWEEGQAPTASDMAMVYLNIQTAYDAICEGIGVSLHQLRIIGTSHPNMSISIEGLGDGIRAFTALLTAVPEIIVRFTIMGRLREEAIRQSEAQIALYEATKNAAEASKSLPDSEKPARIGVVIHRSLPQLAAPSIYMPESAAPSTFTVRPRISVE